MHQLLLLLLLLLLVGAATSSTRHLTISAASGTVQAHPVPMQGCQLPQLLPEIHSDG
jgi:hypothetical protein